MEFFGITDYGPQNYINDILRDDYKEPMQKDEVEPVMQKVLQSSSYPEQFQQGRPDHKIIRKIDCYVGRGNGFAFGSFERFYRMKQKAIMKPVGPIDMYRIPPSTYTEYGWWICDPALTKEKWYHTHPRYPMPVSPNTHVLDVVRKNNKYATLY